jgi:hypothetical protein
VFSDKFDIMRNHFATCLAVLVLASLPVHAADAGKLAAIERFHFLAGLSITGAEMGYIAPPQCESFFREGGEQRAAELFLDAVRAWNANSTTHYYESGKRFVIENPSLSKALKSFYSPSNGPGATELGLIKLDQQERLSFVAGIYARCYRDGAFHGRPSPAMLATVRILRAEGCQISHLNFSKNQVPETMHFQVKLSDSVARIFATVDNWRPPHVEWKQKRR